MADIQPEANPRPCVLIVDDQPEINQVLVETLHHDYLVESAFDGEQARGMIEKKDYDVIILDIVMPFMDGAQLYRWM